MTNLSAAVLVLTFGPVAFALLIVLIHHLTLFRVLVVETSEDEKPEEEQGEEIILPPSIRWDENALVEIDRDGRFINANKVRRKRKELNIIKSLGPNEFRKRFKVVVKGYRFGSSGERRMWRAISHAGNDYTKKKVYVMRSNITGYTYFAYQRQGHKVIISACDWV